MGTQTKGSCLRGYPSSYLGTVSPDGSREETDRSQYDFQGVTTRVRTMGGYGELFLTIVGVSTDDLVEYKGKRSVIPFEERKEIVGAIKYVDEVVTQENMDKLGAWKKYHFDVMFVGDDWKGTDKWNKIEADLKEVGAKVVYFPYTKGTSSTLINETLIRLREGK